MRRRKSTGEYDTELQQVFNVFDKNKDGFIDKDELFDMLSRLGELITEVNMRQILLISWKTNCFVIVGWY